MITEIIEAEKEEASQENARRSAVKQSETEGEMVNCTTRTSF
jgi:hypothetical protein